MRRDDDRIDGHGRTRRRLLAECARCTALLIAAPVVTSLAGCRGEQEDDAGPLVLTKAQLTPGQRQRFDHDHRPIEVLMTAESVTARSLLCTHRGCTVKWNEQEQIYACPCHDGFFDPEGRVIAGPPNRPLQELPVRIEGDTVIVGE